MTWRVDALCRKPDVDPEWFFSEADTDIALAQQVCSRCPVREQCLAEAIENSEEYGVLGGTLPHERFVLGMVRRPVELHDWVAELRLSPCGTNAAYMRHKRRGEDICVDCYAAHARDAADRKAGAA